MVNPDAGRADAEFVATGSHDTAALERAPEQLDLAAAINLLPYGFVAVDFDLTVVFASAGAHEMFGFVDHESMLGVSALDLLHPDDMERVSFLFTRLTGDLDAVLAEPSISRHVELSVRVRHRSGAWIAVGVTGRPVSADGPFILGIRPNKASRTSEDLLSGLALGRSTDQLLGIVIEMAEAQFPGRSAWIVSGLGHGEPTSRGGRALADSVVDEGMASVGPAALIDKGRYWSIGIDDADGRRIGLLIVTSDRHFPDPSPYDREIMSNTARVASLVLQRERSDQALHLALSSDALTGAASRAAFADLVALLDADDLPVTLVYVDVDGFKAVNDSRGHAEGDRVLRRTTERLHRAVRGDDVVARVGGDEFAVLCRRLGSPLADLVIARIRTGFDISCGDEHPDDPTASVGFATANSVEELPDLVDRADADMYRQKRSRRFA